jgi:lysozyme family protein
LSNFDDAFEALIGHEGGYVNDSRDPGGETKFGVSKRSYPAVDIKALTLDGAKAIYKRDFWDKVRGDELPMPVAFNLFDGAVNSGPSQAIKWMQRAAEVADDGKLGPMTLAALLAAEPLLLAIRYNGHRLQFMTDRGTWDDFGKGWARRIARNLMAA